MKLNKNRFGNMLKRLELMIGSNSIPSIEKIQNENENEKESKIFDVRPSKESIDWSISSLDGASLNFSLMSESGIGLGLAETKKKEDKKRDFMQVEPI